MNTKWILQCASINPWFDGRDEMFHSVLRSLLALFCLAYCWAGTEARADVLIAVKAVENTGNKAADGYSMTVSCDPDDGRINVTSAPLTVNKGAAIEGDFAGNNGSANVLVSWTVNIPAGATINRSVSGKGPKSFVSGEGFYFKTAALVPVPSIGWRAEANGDLFMENANMDGVQFNSLYFQFPTSLTLSNVSALLDMSSSGTNGFITSGTVPAASGTNNGELYVAHFNAAP
ncbi:MAG TPA: hypothetical protein VNX46_10260, partial [Candidatus Acidoferrum sp.]|nr:hypothetical protein [Candidatus Acidoferrum sp.]